MIRNAFFAAQAGRRFTLRAILMAGILLPSGLFLFYACQSYRDAFATAEERLGRRSAALAEQLARTFDVQAAVLDLLALRLEDMKPRDLSGAPALYHAFQGRTGSDQVAGAILVIDREGRVLASDRALPGLLVDDRPYFRKALQSPDMVISVPLVSRINGQQIIALARNSGGRVLAVTLRVSDLERILSSRADGLAETPVITLRHDDGPVLAQWAGGGQPKADDASVLPGMRQAQEGIIRLGAARWGDSRLAAHHQLGQYPMRIVYSIREVAIVRTWALGLIPHLLLAASATALLLVATHMVLRRDREATAAVASGIAEAARANRAVSQFLDAAIHDLCQPLQGVRLFLDVLDGRLTRRSDRLALRQAFSALEGAETLLASLRDVSMLEAGLVRPHLQELVMESILAELADEFRAVAAMRGLSLRMVRCTARVRTDPELVRRMLRSLLANAVAFTPSGRILVGGRLHGSTLRIEVWDTGIGIADEHLDVVFEDFVQLGNPERDRKKGLGLGLALVRRLGRLLDIPQGVLSCPGRGSVFWLALPLLSSPSPLIRGSGATSGG